MLGFEKNKLLETADYKRSRGKKVTVTVLYAYRAGVNVRMHSEMTLILLCTYIIIM